MNIKGTGGLKKNTAVRLKHQGRARLRGLSVRRSIGWKRGIHSARSCHVDARPVSTRAAIFGSGARLDFHGEPVFPTNPPNRCSAVNGGQSASLAQWQSTRWIKRNVGSSRKSDSGCDSSSKKEKS